MNSPKIDSTRGFSPAGIPDASIPKSGITRKFRRAGESAQDAVISHESSGVATTKVDPAKPLGDAKAPPLSDKPVPTTSIAERLRGKLKQGS